MQSISRVVWLRRILRRADGPLEQVWAAVSVTLLSLPACSVGTLSGPVPSGDAAGNSGDNTDVAACATDAVTETCWCGGEQITSGYCCAGIAQLDVCSPVVVDGFGLLPIGLRDKLKWPFATSSIWNTPIGTAAIYAPAGILLNNDSGWNTVFILDQDIILFEPTQPFTEVYFNNVGWTGGDRCVLQGAVIATVPVPHDYVVPNSGGNNSAAFLLPDGRTIKQNQPFTRCTAGEPATAWFTFADEDIYGAGIGGAHAGSGLSAVGGTIRLGEFTSGRIHHAMKANLWAKEYYHCCDYRWPARNVDGYADATSYGGINPDFVMGALLALLPSFDVDPLQTTPGRILAQAFKDYGAYVMDDSFSNSWAVATERGPNGRVVDEFAGLYGFSMEQRLQKHPAFMSDLQVIFESLHIVTNNSPDTVGGGGSPRVPLAPEIGN